jgi:hypothetical protein
MKIIDILFLLSILSKTKNTIECEQFIENDFNGTLTEEYILKLGFNFESEIIDLLDENNCTSCFYPLFKITSFINYF